MLCQREIKLIAMDINLWIKIVKEGIKKKNLNPWDVNIAEVADYYINKIKELKKFDIRLSADLVLVGAILLRMKSEDMYSSFKEKKEKKRRKRKISEKELIKEVERELRKVRKKRERVKREKKEDVNLDAIEDLANEMLEDDIEETIKFLLSLVLEEKIIIFQERFKSREEKIKYFLPSLCLANDNLIEIEQKEIFKELILKSKK